MADLASRLERQAELIRRVQAIGARHNPEPDEKIGAVIRRAADAGDEDARAILAELDPTALVSDDDISAAILELLRNRPEADRPH